MVGTEGAVKKGGGAAVDPGTYPSTHRPVLVKRSLLHHPSRLC